MSRQPYLEAVNERVIVFDGAFGTFVQDLDLGPADFGGESLEGCNEMLCLTRPDVIESMHRAFLDAGVDAIETASFGSFSTVLAEYNISDQAYELNVAAASIARRVADSYESDGRPAMWPEVSDQVRNCQALVILISSPCVIHTKSKLAVLLMVALIFS